MQTRAQLHLFEFPIFRHLSLKMTSSQDVEMLVATNSPFQDSFHPHDQIPCKYFCNLFCFQCLSKWPLLSGFLASLGYCCYFLFLLWQGWPSGESTCLPPMWPGFDFRTRRHMWVEFVGSLLCYERFSPEYSGFPLSPKTNI